MDLCHLYAGNPWVFRVKSLDISTNSKHNRASDDLGSGIAQENVFFNWH